MAKAANSATGFNPDVVQNLVSRIETLFADIATLRDQCKEDCAPLREDIRHVYAEAEHRGIPKQELNKYVTARMKLAAIRKMLDSLESEQRDTVEMLSQAFGDAADLPLFEHRIRTAQAAQETHAQA